MLDNNHSGWVMPSPTDGNIKYVWEIEDRLPKKGNVTAVIGDIKININLKYVHERRYALGLIFGFRNPQADIDRLLFRSTLRPGDVVLDGGANIGITAAEALACGAKHVICIEPENSLVNRLVSLKLQRPNGISVWHCALGAAEGVANLFLSQSHNQGHTISPAMIGFFPDIFDGSTQRVRTTTVDSMSALRPSDDWKLDVEGVEADIIKGARRTLEQSPPRIILAEIYDAFIADVVGLLPGYHMQRAAIAKSDYALKLLSQVGGQLSDEFCPTSPTYVFTRRDCLT